MHVNVAIVGLDRLGTSLGMALKRYQSQPKSEHTFTIIGSDPKAEAMKTAQKLGAVDNFNRALLKATDGADLLIINVPYSSAEDFYARLGPELKPGAMVLDTSLLKQPAIDWADQYFRKNERGQLLAYLVGITPIVNINGLYSADLGAEGGRADLFDQTDVLITPHAKCPEEAVALAEDVIRLIGGKPRFMDPLEHDGLIAATEQLPALLGASLFFTLQQSEGWMELRRMVNPTMALMIQSLRYQTAQDMLSVFKQNRENLARHLEALIGSLDQVHDALTSSNPDMAELEAFISVVYKEWEKWDIKRFSGSWEEASNTPDLMPGQFGFGSGFFSLRRRKKDKDGENEDE
jgi:prephenate dehydrogenase